MLSLANPAGVRTLTEAESTRLRAQYPPSDLPSSPEHCPTCHGKHKFLWWNDPASPTRLAVEYECPCEDQWVLHRFLLNAGVDKAYQQLCWGDMQWANPDAVEVIHHYLATAESYVSNGFGIVMYGSQGTGKTALATLLLKRLLGDGYDGYFTTFNAMIDIFTSGWHDRDDKAWFHRRIKNAGVLVLDDPGKEMKGRAALPESLLDEVIRSRVSGLRPTIITTNDDMQAFGVRYGKYVMSLLQERAMTFAFNGQDARVASRQRMHDEVDQGLTRPLVIG